MKTVLDFLGQLWLRFLKPNGPITIPHQTEGKAKRFSGNNLILQKSLETFLQEIIEFRFNLLSEETEYRYKRSEADRFYPVTQRDLNSICMEARRTGIDCWDRDVNRFVYSKEVKEYHPFRQYMERLPEWEVVATLASVSTAACVPGCILCSQDWSTDDYNSKLLSFEL